jgi:hypothetical protein
VNLKDESDEMSPRDASYGACPKDVSDELSPKEESDGLRRRNFADVKTRSRATANVC